MFDYKSEFINLIDTIPLQDGATRLQLAQQLEDAFVQRLQATLLTALTTEQRESLLSQTDISSEEFFAQVYDMIDDVDELVDETFESFKAEFLDNIS